MKKCLYSEWLYLIWVAVKVLYQNTASVLTTEYVQLKMEAGGSSERLVHMDNTTTLLHYNTTIIQHYNTLCKALIFLILQIPLSV